jgi:hypothetical protein
MDYECIGKTCFGILNGLKFKIIAQLWINWILIII